MPKITDYLPDNPSPSEDFFLIAYGGLNYKVLFQNAMVITDNAILQPIVSDLVTDTTNRNDRYYNIVYGIQTSPEEDHQGQIINELIGADRLLRVQLKNSSTHLVKGGDTFEAIIKYVGSFTVSMNSVIGFGDPPVAAGAPTPVNGAYFFINSNTAVGTTKIGAAISTTGSSYTILINTWYRYKVEVNAAANRVDFYIYDMNNVLLWNDFLTTNIPVAAGQGTDIQVNFKKPDAAAGGGPYLDWIAFYNSNPLTR